MKSSAIGGLIKRGVFVTFRVVPEILQKELPPRFRPRMHFGHAIAGITLMRLEQVRPQSMPAFLGGSSENVFHHYAVQWDDDKGQVQDGIYVVRRDTDSRVNRIMGGQLFPGEHRGARFRVDDKGQGLEVEMVSSDKATVVQVRGKIAEGLPAATEFEGVEQVSEFLAKGAVAYSPTRDGRRYEGLRLTTATWDPVPIKLDHHYATFFNDQVKFPPHSVTYDCALLMRDVQHEWQSEPDIYA